MPRPEETREEALKRLDAQADALEARTTKSVQDYGSQAVSQAYRMLAELLGGVFVGLAVGLIFDFFAGTRPWGTVAGVVLGFCVSIWIAYRSARHAADRLSKEMGPPKSVPFDDEDEV